MQVSRTFRIGVGLVWAVGGLVALNGQSAVTDDPMDPAYGASNGQGKRLAVAPNAAPDSTVLRERALVAAALKSSLDAVSFSAPFDEVVGGSPRSLVVADFDGDGLEDVAVANKVTDDVSFLLASGPGSFLSPRSFAAGVQPRSIAAGDFNDDGLADIVVANKLSFDLTVLLSDGMGGFESRSTSVSEEPGAVAVADLDRDGNDDVVVTFPESNRVAVLRGEGDGRLAANVLFITGRAPVAVAVADFDGDGLLDVVTANRLSNDVSVLRGAGDGTLESHRVYDAGIGPLHLVVTDLDADGVADLVVADYDNNALALLRGNGVGGFGLPTYHATGAGPAWLAAGDLNADGAVDVAVVNFDSGNVMIFAGDGAGALSQVAALASGVGPRSLAASDLDDDGRIDLVTASRDDDTVRWFLNEGPFPPAIPPTAVAAADRTHECSSKDGATVNLDGTESFADATAGALVEFEWLLADGKRVAKGVTASVELPVGAHLLTLRVTDEAGETAEDTVEVVVEDTTAPTLEFELDPTVLAPADHRMVPVKAELTADDTCGDVTVTLLSVVSDQPADAPGAFDGTTTQDIQGAVIGTADFSLSLRAENDWRDRDGRIYSVTYQVRDASGNTVEATRTVVVPYDPNGQDDPVDEDDDPVDENDDPWSGGDGDDDDDDDDHPWSDGDDDDDDDDDDWYQEDD